MPRCAAPSRAVLLPLSAPCLNVPLANNGGRLGQGKAITGGERDGNMLNRCRDLLLYTGGVNSSRVRGSLRRVCVCVCVGEGGGGADTRLNTDGNRIRNGEWEDNEGSNFMDTLLLLDSVGGVSVLLS